MNARSTTTLPRHARALLAAGLLALAGGCASTQAPEPVTVKVLAINDFHGHLKAPAGTVRMPDPTDPTRSVAVSAGGAEHLASAVRTLRETHPHHVFVAAGDLVGASPLLSALFRDEPTVESLSLMGLELAAVGNHEFDKGADELLRLQRGGCHPQDGCRGPRPFAGAGFQYLAASTIVRETGQTLLPAYRIKRFAGIPVAFVGLTLQGTPGLVMPSGVRGLRFDDEVRTVNRLVPELRAQGVEAIVVLIHEGGLPAGTDPNGCDGISGAIVDIVRRLDRAVDVVISGHTHRAYNCRIDGRLVTSGHAHGTMLTQIDLVLDPSTGDVRQARADNVVVDPRRFSRDPAQTELIAAYETLAAPLAQRVVGRLTHALSRNANAAGESPLGQVIADAQLHATRAAGAQVALTNPGGIRRGLGQPSDGRLRFEDLFAAQPFGNQLVTMTLSGAQLLQLLERQWRGQPEGGRVLQVSQGFGYRWDASRPPGQRVVPGSLRLDGRALGPDDEVRVTVNSFMADGGDGFSLLRQGRDRVTGVTDVEALEAWFRDRDVAPGRQERIRRVN